MYTLTDICVTYIQIQTWAKIGNCGTCRIINFFGSDCSVDRNNTKENDAKCGKPLGLVYIVFPLLTVKTVSRNLNSVKEGYIMMLFVWSVQTN